MIAVLVVSHSKEAALGITKIAAEMSGGIVEVRGVGGGEGGTLGISVAAVHAALSELLAVCEGVVVVPDIGSSVLSTRGAIALLPEQEGERISLANAPILEGAMLAAIEAMSGSSLSLVTEAAEQARSLDKLR